MFNVHGAQHSWCVGLGLGLGLLGGCDDQPGGGPCLSSPSNLVYYIQEAKKGQKKKKKKKQTKPSRILPFLFHRTFWNLG